jgi:hypothetical protein
MELIAGLLFFALLHYLAYLLFKDFINRPKKYKVISRLSGHVFINTDNRDTAVIEMNKISSQYPNDFIDIEN